MLPLTRRQISYFRCSTVAGAQDQQCVQDVAFGAGVDEIAAASSCTSTSAESRAVNVSSNLTGVSSDTYALSQVGSFAGCSDSPTIPQEDEIAKPCSFHRFAWTSADTEFDGHANLPKPRGTVSTLTHRAEPAQSAMPYRRTSGRSFHEYPENCRAGEEPSQTLLRYLDEDFRAGPWCGVLISHGGTSTE